MRVFVGSVFQLLLFGIQKISTEPIYGVRRYRLLQNLDRYQPNIRYYADNLDVNPGFRLKTGISEQQKAELSWLAANSEPDGRPKIRVAPRAQPLYWTTQRPPPPAPWTQVSYRRFSGTPANRTRPYIPNFQTAPPIYYGGSPLGQYVPEGYLPVSTMVSAINKILSIVQKTMGPGGSVSSGSAGETNFIGSGQPEQPINPENGGVGEEELIDAEQVKGTPIRKAEELEKSTNSASSGELDGNKESKNNTSTSVPPVTESPLTDDGSNLLDSLLHGRLDKVDWFGSLLGTSQLPSTEEGNAVAQIFQGGIFGPAN